MAKDFPQLAEHQLVEYRTVVLGALLHDIGKFLQRGDFGSLDVAGKHPQVSSDFVGAFADCFARVVDIDLLKTLVQRHHESERFPAELRVQDIPDPRTRALAYIVSRADNLSSSERGQRAGEWRDYKTARLASVFGRISVRGQGAASTLYHPAQALGDIASLENVVFPQPSAAQARGEVNRVLEEFGQDFTRLKDSLNWGDFDCVVAHLLTLLQRYTWAFPSDTQEETPDVSLFHHLKTTAAIAACLYLYHARADTLHSEGVTKGQEPRFRLVAGDLSGIQSYIFDIAAVGTGGVAKRLRARSFFVHLLAEAASHLIVRRLGLTLCNVLMASGGKYYVLLPNTKEAVEAVSRTQREIDDWLLQVLNGEICLNLASVELGDGGFQAGASADDGFGGVLERLSEALAARKQRRFNEVLIDDGGFREDVFLLATDFTGKKPCSSCGKFPANEGELCDQCDRDAALGAALPRARYLAFYDDGHGQIPLYGGSAAVLRDEREIAGRPYLVVALNHPEVSSLAQVPATFRYLASYTPQERPCDDCPARQCEARVTARHEPADFHCIANRSHGKALLGVLKADIDRLGETFIFGLKRSQPDASYDTVSRLATLSQRLDLFFSGWVEHLTSREFRDCYTVYSGGDDLLLIGPWNRVLDLAQRLRDDFARFANHPAVTLSAGIALVKPRYPVSNAARDADNALKEAKRGDTGQQGRNSLSILDHTLRWDDLPFVRRQATILDETTPEVRSSFLYSLLSYGEMWRRFSRKGNARGLRFQPLLAYNVARNLDRRRQPDLHAWASKLIGLRTGDEEQKKTLDNLRLIAGLALMGRRGGN